MGGLQKLLLLVKLLSLAILIYLLFHDNYSFGFFSLQTLWHPLSHRVLSLYGSLLCLCVIFLLLISTCLNLSEIIKICTHISRNILLYALVLLKINNKKLEYILFNENIKINLLSAATSYLYHVYVHIFLYVNWSKLHCIQI